MPANHRVEFSLTSEFSQIAPERIERRRFGLFPVFTPFGCIRSALFFLDRHGPVVVGVEHRHNFFAGLIEIHTHIFEHAGGNAFAFAQQTEQNMLGSDIAVAERAGLAGGQCQHFFRARGKRNIAAHFGAAADANRFFHFEA